GHDFPARRPPRPAAGGVLPGSSSVAAILLRARPAPRRLERRRVRGPRADRAARRRGGRRPAGRRAARRARAGGGGGGSPFGAELGVGREGTLKAGTLVGELLGLAADVSPALRVHKVATRFRAAAEPAAAASA